MATVYLLTGSRRPVALIVGERVVDASTYVVRDARQPADLGAVDLSPRLTARVVAIS